MPVPLTDEDIHALFGSLSRVLESLPAAKIRVVAGDAGFDLGRIPDGLDEAGTGTRRPPIMSGIHGQWNEWGRERRLRVLPKLAEAIETFQKPRTGGGEVNAAILKHGYRFENGGFVPVNAFGEIPKLTH
jgi:hypothetical protein